MKCKKCGMTTELAGRTITGKTKVLRCVSCGTCYIRRQK